METGRLYRVKPGFDLEPLLVGHVGKMTGWGQPTTVKVPIIRFEGQQPEGYAEHRPWPIMIAVHEMFLEPADTTTPGA